MMRGLVSATYAARRARRSTGVAEATAVCITWAGYALRLTGGEFIKVGKANAIFLDHMQRLDELRQKRETLQRSLNQLDREIIGLQQVIRPGEKTQKD